MTNELREIDIQPTDCVAFIHIPKTAGLTFNALVSPLLLGLPRCPALLFEHFVQLPYEELMQYRLFMGHFTYKLIKMVFPAGFMTLTFLREPVSRTISHYQFLLRQETMGVGELGDAELQLVKKMTLEEFLSNTDLHLALDIINMQTRHLGDGLELEMDFVQKHSAKGADVNTVHSKSEPSLGNELEKIATQIGLNNSSYVQPVWYPNARHLELAKRRIQDAAFFGITERFQDSLFLLSFTFGWPPLLDSVHLNHAPAASIRLNKLDPNTISNIQAKIGLDAELYRFGCDVFEQRFNEMTQVLLQHYGDEKQRDLKLPLPADVMFTLLQKHYEARRDYRNQRLLQNIGTSYVYHPSSQVEGAFGWYPAENSEKHGWMVWSGSGRESGFDLPCPRGGAIRVSFRVLMTLQPDILAGLTLTANGAAITLKRATDHDGAAVFSGEIPSTVISGPFLRLVFSVPRTIAPRAINPKNQDERELGILLNWIKLEAFGS